MSEERDRVVMQQLSQSLRRRRLPWFGDFRVAAGVLAMVCIVAVLLVLMPEQAGIQERPHSGPGAEEPVAAFPAQGEDRMEETPAADAAALATEARRFEFYSVMPAVEPEKPAEYRGQPSVTVVPLPVLDSSPPPDPSPPPVRALASREGSYYLQLEGYRSLAEAGKMKDKLEFMRLHVRIGENAVGSGPSYYRLQVGPYSDPVELERVQTLLGRRGIESTPVPAR